MTLADILVALVIVMMIVGATFTLADPIRQAVSVQAETAEVHQRVRAGFARLETDLRNAGVARTLGGRSPFLPRAPVVPARSVGQRRARGGTASNVATDAITVVQATEFPRATTGSRVSPSELSVALVDGPGCAGLHRSCGFRPNMTVMVFDDQGHSDVLKITHASGNVLRVAPPAGGRILGYPAGSMLMPVVVRSYYFAADREQLRLRSEWGADAPVLDNVVGVSFRYFGRPQVPPVDGTTRARVACLATSSGAATVPPVQVELSPSLLGDGPWCGGGAVFDVDLLRVQRVQVTFLLQTPRPEHRGLNPRLFANPGDARAPAAWVPDVTARFDVAVGNPWRP
jgi:hypothetical protein